MRHYEPTQWVNFARNLGSEAELASMRAHLGGCAGCSETADFFSRLAHTTRNMSSVAVPDAVLRTARAIFPVQTPRLARRPSLLPLQLVYDNFLTPAPAGLRSTWQVGWQALYRAGDCSLDLRIEPELRTSRAAVIGQISNHEAPEFSLADLPVCLKAGQLVVAETRSNQFGEFQMEYEQQNRLQLCIYLDGGTRAIEVPLKSFGSHQPAEDSPSASPDKRTDPDRQ